MWRALDGGGDPQVGRTGAGTHKRCEAWEADDKASLTECLVKTPEYKTAVS